MGAEGRISQRVDETVRGGAGRTYLGKGGAVMKNP